MAYDLHAPSPRNIKRYIRMSRTSRTAMMVLTLIFAGAVAVSNDGQRLIAQIQPPPVPKRAAEAPVDAKAIRVDSYGDPLPEGVRSRVGSSRLRQGDYVDSLAYSPDGKIIASNGR